MGRSGPITEIYLPLFENIPFFLPLALPKSPSHTSFFQFLAAKLEKLVTRVKNKSIYFYNNNISSRSESFYTKINKERENMFVKNSYQNCEEKNWSNHELKTFTFFTTNTAIFFLQDEHAFFPLETWRGPPSVVYFELKEAKLLLDLPHHAHFDIGLLGFFQDNRKISTWKRRFCFHL